MTKIGMLTDEEYERQSSLVYRKGTYVRVTGCLRDRVDELRNFAANYASDHNSQWRESAKAALKEAEAMQAAVGQVRQVRVYTMGSNPHGIYVNGLLLFLPAECLSPV